MIFKLCVIKLRLISTFFVPDYKYREVINHSLRNLNENFEEKISSQLFQKNIEYFYLFIFVVIIFNIELIFPNIF